MDATSETPFRIGFALFWVVNFIVRLYFQGRARGAQRAFVRNQHGAVLGFRVFAIAYLVLILYSLTTWLDVAHVGLPAWLRWTVGIVLLMLYLILFSWSHLELGKQWSGLVEIHVDHAMVTSGPYRLVRHPMYAAFYLSCLGIFVFTSNWLISLVYFLAASFMYLSRVSSEEEMMIERFGEAYREYMSQTGRLLPRTGFRRRTS